MSKKPVILSLFLVGLILMAILTAGCIGVSFSPSEVKVHGNIISVDSNYIGDELVAQLLFNPNSYEGSYISAISTYIPKTSPVLEIGAKFGVVTSFVADQIKVGTGHVAVEANPALYSLLTKTKENNGMVTTLLNNVIRYDIQLPDDINTTVTVPYDYQKDSTFGALFAANTSNKVVEVPVTTISRLLQNDLFKGSTNVTLLIDDDNVAKTLFTNETKLSDSVEYIFMNIADSSLVKTIVKQAALYGYVNTTYPAAGSDGYTVLVFKRTTGTSNGILNNTEEEKETPIESPTTDNQPKEGGSASKEETTDTQ